MLAGECQCEKTSFIKSTFEAVGKYRNGEITEEELQNLEEEACPTVGSCQGLYTANTMACLTEVLGMSLPECATASAVSAKKKRIAFDSGYRAVELVKENLCPLDIITMDSLKNAIKNKIVMSGSLFPTTSIIFKKLSNLLDFFTAFPSLCIKNSYKKYLCYYI